MDGMIPHLVVGQVDKQAGPQPYCTTDMEALRAVSAGHARRIAKEAAVIAEFCTTHIAADHASAARAHADVAALAAEAHHRREAERRAFLADRIEGLRDAGRLSFAQHRAAEEIADLLAWFEAGKQVMARSQFSERMAASSSTITLQQRLGEAERLRYAPWRAWSSDFPVKVGRSLEDLVRTFIMQGLGIRQLANAFCMDQRRAERLLVRALGCYAAIAGWEAGAKPA